MINSYTFPFGQPLRDVVQTDRTPKKVFVLGVYSSAVHARWIGMDRKTVVNALAVASEPYIFWRGDQAEEIVGQISIPQALGSLVPAHQQFNGPSGIVLDQMILNPLGLEREDAWLCDLVPHSCANPAQQAAIDRAYHKVAMNHGLAEATVPSVPAILADENRRREILAELLVSGANTLILLGDEPIKWFLQFFDSQWKKLSDFGHREAEYGKLHTACIAGKELFVLGLAHPRQIARLGHSSGEWFSLHRAWLKNSSNGVRLA